MSTDRELVDQALLGDHGAFTTLLQRHDSMARGLAYRLLGSREAMDDALQDSYVKAFRRLQQFDGRSSFATWLHSIVYRTCLDQIRYEGRRRHESIDDVESPATDSAHLSSRPGPEHLTVVQDEVGRVLSSLDPERAATVVLVDGMGLSHDEAGEILGVAPGTIASRLHRARAIVRNTLLPEGDRHD